MRQATCDRPKRRFEVNRPWKAVRPSECDNLITYSEQQQSAERHKAFEEELNKVGYTIEKVPPNEMSLFTCLSIILYGHRNRDRKIRYQIIQHMANEEATNENTLQTIAKLNSTTVKIYESHSTGKKVFFVHFYHLKNNRFLNFKTVPIRIIGEKSIGKDSLKLLRNNSNHYDAIIQLCRKVKSETIDISDDEPAEGDIREAVTGEI